MKSLIKQSLFIAISLALAALTARRLNEESSIEADLDEPGSDQPDARPPKLPTNPTRALSEVPPRAVCATTVTFSGTVVRNGPCFALLETAGALYPLDSAGRAWSFEGEDVRVTGKIDLSTRLLHVDAIESAVL